MARQQQYENQHPQLDMHAPDYTAQAQRQARGIRSVPLKNRLILGGALSLTSTILLFGLLAKQLAGVAFLLFLFLSIGLLFSVLLSLKSRKQISESKFIFWLGIVLLVIGFCSIVGMLLGLTAHWWGL